MTALITEDRIQREKSFHDIRFSEEIRDNQAKYYLAIQHGYQRYWDLIGGAILDRDGLEYGCAKGENALRLAPACRSISGIDISDVAIDQARKAQAVQGVGNAAFQAMNAEAMTFEDASFDVVFGSGILHHLDLGKALGEIHRVLRPGGQAIFLEPLGHNAVINAYRRRTPEARTVDEHPLMKSDIVEAERVFRNVRKEFFGLSTLGVVPFRTSVLQRPALSLLRRADDILLRAPGLKWQAWTVVLAFEK